MAKVMPQGDTSYMGKKVTVTMDRPIGTEHPKHPGLIYPINYGYIEGLVAGDGEEQDVYLLGVSEPLEKAECVIIGIIHRLNDNEDKWVAVPEALVGTDICYECNIVHETYFQEQYYKSEVYALYEKTSGAVIYTDDNGERKYFLIKNKSGHIGFPKGHIEYGEKERENALREVYEECGLNVILNDKFRAEYTFRTLENTEKTSVFFLGYFDKEAAVTIQQEEVIGDWLLSYNEAMEKLNWEQDKEILKKAEDFLNDNT
ncbi:MAG: NUDIX domain-containing protein [Ruminococcaceae bacterium]|nr:NUDIX domain-containing protein [Oscillospiraceae bacterium]